MIEVQQTVMHDPENGKIGNCFSAVLASLLHLQIEEVPLFVSDGWLKDLNLWLRQFGLAYVVLDGMREYCQEKGVLVLHHEIAGKSPRSTDSEDGAFNHACVGIDGEFVFDPHPSNAGFIGKGTCGVFIALEPWRMAERAKRP